MILDDNLKENELKLLLEISKKEKEIPKKYQKNISNLIAGKIALINNNNDSALYFLNKANDINTQIKDKLLNVIWLQNLGYVMENKNNSDSAGYYYYTSLSQKIKNKYNFLLPNSYYKYSIYLYKKDLYEDAILNCKKAISYSNYLDSINPFYYNVIGNSFYNLEMDDSAIKYYELGINLSLKNNDKESYIGIKSNLNNLYTIQRKFDTAISNFNELYNYFNNKNEVYQKAVVLANIGNIYIYKSELDSALFYIAESNKIAEKNKYFDIIKNNYDILSNVYVNKDNYIKAYQNLILKQKYGDSLRENKNKNFIKELESKYLNEEQKNLINIQKIELEKKNLQKGIAIIVALLILVISIIVILIYQRRIRAEKILHIMEINNMLKDSEDKIFKSLFEGREKERIRLSEELHDGIGSQLALCKMQLSMFTLDNFDHSKISSITRLVDKVSKDIRSLSHEMNTGNTYGFNITNAIMELCDEINKTNIIKIHFSRTGETIMLDENRNINLYRIVQEIINNTLKHAKAKEINIHLHKDDVKISILIEDNGNGFNTKQKSEGIGLKNIRSRIAEINGEISIDSAIGFGTTTIIEIPSKIKKHI